MEIKITLLEAKRSGVDLLLKFTPIPPDTSLLLDIVEPKQIKMEENHALHLKLTKRQKGIGLVIFLLLLAPLAAMQITTEVNWSLMDFLVAGVLLMGGGLLFELIMSNIKTRKFRIIFCCVLLLVFLLIWAELAVGIFGTMISGN